MEMMLGPIDSTWVPMDQRRKFSAQLLAGKRFEVRDPANNIVREVPAKCIRAHFFAFSHLRLAPVKGSK